MHAFIRTTLLILLAAASVAVAAEAEEQPAGYEPTVLITGANRGIGLEFARQYAARGWHVIGTARDPDTAADL